ncbi:hypothetical protein H4R99_006146 [Coemansia sp. RSA 1722]|nr:hypothetical protein LPJ57_005714 [Coemansia sp. RSA 486]KAJ2226253.1 hypothetical protein IWW45_007543 [Coemansia sp. RSA 485]KAJ2593269.1 hypothetical protein H4R99_006146 [Coemansia sp. RSA 1722]
MHLGPMDHMTPAICPAGRIAKALPGPGTGAQRWARVGLGRGYESVHPLFHCAQQPGSETQGAGAGNRRSSPIVAARCGARGRRSIAIMRAARRITNRKAPPATFFIFKNAHSVDPGSKMGKSAKAFKRPTKKQKAAKKETGKSGAASSAPGAGASSSGSVTRTSGGGVAKAKPKPKTKAASSRLKTRLAAAKQTDTKSKPDYLRLFDKKH